LRKQTSLIIFHQKKKKKKTLHDAFTKNCSLYSFIRKTKQQQQKKTFLRSQLTVSIIYL